MKREFRIILKLLLNFSDVEPQYFYKLYLLLQNMFLHYQKIKMKTRKEEQRIEEKIAKTIHLVCIGLSLGPVYTIPFSYEDGTEMFRFGLASTLYRFPIRHQMKVKKAFYET